MLRVGSGHDTHRLVEGRPLVLGGVRVEHPRGLIGHSDADVVLHAVTDALAASDVYWDEVTSVTPDGEEEAFDLTVPGPANFIANSIYAHNSIEQDADTVLLLHRPGKYEGGQEDNVIEVLVAKQRNGPTGDVTLAYLKQYMRYENYAVGGPTGIDL